MMYSFKGLKHGFGILDRMQDPAFGLKLEAGSFVEYLPSGLQLTFPDGEPVAPGCYPIEEIKKTKDEEGNDIVTVQLGVGGHITEPAAAYWFKPVNKAGEGVLEWLREDTLVYSAYIDDALRKYGEDRVADALEAGFDARIGHARKMAESSRGMIGGISKAPDRWRDKVGLPSGLQMQGSLEDSLQIFNQAAHEYEALKESFRRAREIYGSLTASWMFMKVADK